MDDILSYLVNAADVLIEPLHTLFNKILDKILPCPMGHGSFCSATYDDINNFRGITLISCFAKLFTSILNDCLKLWPNVINTSSDAQY